MRGVGNLKELRGIRGNLYTSLMVQRFFCVVPGVFIVVDGHMSETVGSFAERD